MKKILLLAITLSFFFTACENDPFENTIIEEQTATATIEDLAIPDNDAPALTADAPAPILETLAAAKVAEMLPTKMLGAGESSGVTDRSCIQHWDMPVFYNVVTGGMRIEEQTACFDWDNPYGGYRSSTNIGRDFFNIIPLEDDWTYGDGRGLYLASEFYGALRIGSVDRYGVRRDVRNYNWVDHWTHAVALHEPGMFMFYSGILGGKIYIGKYTLAGGWQRIREYGSWTTRWSQFTHIGNGKVLTYDGNTGDLWVNQIDAAGNWTVLSTTNIGTGHNKIVALGNQTEVREGVCCYPIGRGFMAYNSNTNQLKIYNVKTSDNQVQWRKTYNTTGWRFDEIAQLQGNKFVMLNNATDRVYIGQMSETGNWSWNKSYYIDNQDYGQILTMSFR